MARTKTTVYIDDALLRATKVAAAQAGKHQYEVVEEALQEHLGLASVVQRIWSGIPVQQAPDDDESTRIVAEELIAVRGTTGRRAG